MKIILDENANPTHRKITNRIAMFASKVKYIKSAMTPDSVISFYNKNKDLIKIIGEGSVNVYKDSVKSEEESDLDRPQD